MFKRKSFLLVVILLLSLVLPTLSLADVESPKSSNSQIIHESFYSEILGRDYNYNIYLPTGYKTSDKDYPVLYLLHGSGGNENDWVQNGDVKATADRLIEKGEIPASIIVMPGAKSWWVNGYNENAETAFFQDLIPHIDSTWKTIDTKEGRLVAGLSAGGYGTVNYIMSHPDMFAAGAALSPASYVDQPPSNSSGNTNPTYQKPNPNFDPSKPVSKENPKTVYDPAKWTELNYTSRIDGYKNQEIRVPLFIETGDHDVFNIAYHSAVLFQKLRDLDATQKKLVEFRVIDGDHEWKVWKESLPDAMKYMYQFVNVK